MVTLGSLFDGIGGWPLAATRYGIVPLWASEIAEFPKSVTAYHFPNMKQLGDITKLDGAKVDPVDIITLGSPCQDLSVAGKRKGLSGERSGLFICAVEFIQRMRKSTSGKYPRFAVWENVPGAFSSNSGHDFRAVLEAFSEAEVPMPEGGRWAEAGLVELQERQVAWRCLDARYAVPQRRKRIFLVTDFRGHSAGEILFERQGLSGNTTQGQRTVQETSRSVNDCSENAGRIKLYDMTHCDDVIRVITDGIVPTLKARMGTGGNQVTLVSGQEIKKQ